MSRPRWWHAGRRRTTLAAGLVLGGLAGYVLLVYVVVVLGGGLLVGRTSSPDLMLSVLATAVVALSFERVAGFLDRRSTALGRARGKSSYDLLRSFSSVVSGSGTGDVPLTMARVLAAGTGASWVQIWLVRRGRVTLAAGWPEYRTATPAPEVVSDLDAVEVDQVTRESTGRRSVRLHQSGELLGLIVLQERDGVPLTGTEERLLSGLADQAGVVLQGVRLREELQHRSLELSVRASELRLARQRLVEAQDAERRRLERDIHDGAQQHLVALAVNLRLAHSTAARSPVRAAELLSAQEQAVTNAIETLLNLTRGIYPRHLVDQGLVAALRAAADTSPMPVVVEAGSVQRYSPAVEAAVYFCCVEALQNAAKHSHGSCVRVSIRDRGTSLICSVEDDGVGLDLNLARAARGIANMRDRVEVVGGSLTVGPGLRRGTRVETIIPTRPGIDDG